MAHFTGFVARAPHTSTENGEKTLRFELATKAGDQITMHTVVMPQGHHLAAAERAAQRGKFVQVIGSLITTDEGKRLINAAIVAEPDTHTSEPIARYNDPSGDYIINRSRDTATGSDQLETMIFHGTFLVDAFGQDLTRAPEFDGDHSDQTKITERFHSCVDRSLAWIDGKAYTTGNPHQF